MDFPPTDILVLLIPIVALVGGIGIAIFVIRAKQRERMAMIEQGLDPDEREREHKERLAMIEQGLDPDEGVELQSTAGQVEARSRDTRQNS